MTDTMSSTPKTAVLMIDGMSCSGCSQSVERALKAVAGVSEVRVDLATKQATVTYDATVGSDENFVKAVLDSGYQARMA